MLQPARHGRVRRCTSALDRPLRDLELLAELLEALENEAFESPALAGLAQSVARDGTSASRIVAKRRCSHRLQPGALVSVVV